MSVAHARISIRAALKVALTGLTSTGTHVYDRRMNPQNINKFLQVLTGDEPQITEGFNENPDLERQMDIQVRCLAKDQGGIDDVLDTMLSEVEIAMNSAGTLGGLVQDISAPKSITITGDDTLEKPVGIAEINFVVTYYTRAGTPGTTI